MDSLNFFFVILQLNQQCEIQYQYELSFGTSNSLSFVTVWMNSTSLVPFFTLALSLSLSLYFVDEDGSIC